MLDTDDHSNSRSFGYNTMRIRNIRRTVRSQSKACFIWAILCSVLMGSSVGYRFLKIKYKRIVETYNAVLYYRSRELWINEEIERLRAPSTTGSSAGTLTESMIMLRWQEQHRIYAKTAQYWLIYALIREAVGYPRPAPPPEPPMLMPGWAASEGD